MLGLWPGLTRFLDDPRIPIDDNHTERGNSHDASGTARPLMTRPGLGRPFPKGVSGDARGRPRGRRDGRRLSRPGYPGKPLDHAAMISMPAA
jgi:hypothetical protein